MLEGQFPFSLFSLFSHASETQELITVFFFWLAKEKDFYLHVGKSISKVLNGQMEKQQYLVSRHMGISTKERSIAAAETRGDGNWGAERGSGNHYFS